jgi:DNA-binding transcriptional LysR family regulator
MPHPRDLPLLFTFAAVVRRGSFTAAARDLGLSKSSVSEQVRALEERCGVRLLERSTRSVRSTQAGERVMASAAAVADAALALDAVLEEQRGAPVGTLRVATTQDLGPRLVAPLAARLARQHPGLSVEVVSEDGPSDLVKGGFDLAVRLGVPRAQGRVAIRLAEVPEPIVAAPALAAAYAGARRPRELRGAPWAQHALLAGTEVMTFVGPGGARQEVAVVRRARANTGQGVRALLLHGAGLGVLPEYLVAGDLRRGALVRLCPGWVWKVLTLYVELPSRRQKPRRVQLFLEAIREAVAGGVLVGDG